MLVKVLLAACTTDSLTIFAVETRSQMAVDEGGGCKKVRNMAVADPNYRNISIICPFDAR